MMPGFTPYSAVEKEKVMKKGKKKVNRFEKKGKKSFGEVYGKGKK